MQTLYVVVGILQFIKRLRFPPTTSTMQVIELGVCDAEVP